MIGQEGEGQEQNAEEMKMHPTPTISVKAILKFAFLTTKPLLLLLRNS